MQFAPALFIDVSLAAANPMYMGFAGATILLAGTKAAGLVNKKFQISLGPIETFMTKVVGGLFTAVMAQKGFMLALQCYGAVGACGVVGIPVLAGGYCLAKLIQNERFE